MNCERAFLSSGPLSLRNITKNNSQGSWKERNVDGVEEWGLVKSCGSGGQREGSEQEIPPFIPPPIFVPFPRTRGWTLSEVQIHCHGEWMNEWCRLKFQDSHGMTNLSPCHLYQLKNLHNDLRPSVPPLTPPEAPLSSWKPLCPLGPLNGKFQGPSSNFQGPYLSASKASVLWRRLQWYLTHGADISSHICGTTIAPVHAEGTLDQATCGLKV